MYDADGDADSGGDLAARLALGVAGEDRGVLVVVDDGAPAADPVSGSGRLQAVLHLLDDVAAAVLGEGERQGVVNASRK
ncbi:hypothetical protein [Streptomyces sp. NRRL F-5053]|uniref:hypothetical protein n=1 Tax=Streptomyces sp. NRRL F-5053 TaxID=1463854 RepID=UPI0013319E63|nr:hypothetical protein [Streptomyces sp. NRRL F-5053]